MTTSRSSRPVTRDRRIVQLAAAIGQAIEQRGLPLQLALSDLQRQFGGPKVAESIAMLKSRRRTVADEMALACITLGYRAPRGHRRGDDYEPAAVEVALIPQAAHATP